MNAVTEAKGDAIRALLARRKLTQSDVATLLNVTRQEVSRKFRNGWSDRSTARLLESIGATTEDLGKDMR